jgi:hypothetical protein
VTLANKKRRRQAQGPRTVNPRAAAARRKLRHYIKDSGQTGEAPGRIRDPLDPVGVNANEPLVPGTFGIERARRQRAAGVLGEQGTRLLKRRLASRIAVEAASPADLPGALREAIATKKAGRQRGAPTLDQALATLVAANGGPRRAPGWGEPVRIAADQPAAPIVVRTR